MGREVGRNGPRNEKEKAEDLKLMKDPLYNESE